MVDNTYRLGLRLRGDDCFISPMSHGTFFILLCCVGRSDHDSCRRKNLSILSGFFCSGNGPHPATAGKEKPSAALFTDGKDPRNPQLSSVLRVLVGIVLRLVLAHVETVLGRVSSGCPQSAIDVRSDRVSLLRIRRQHSFNAYRSYRPIRILPNGTRQTAVVAIRTTAAPRRRVSQSRRNS